IELPTAWREALVREEQALEAAVPGFARWVKPELMHLTLLFLGAQPQAVLDRVHRSMEAVCTGRPAFSLEPGELGSFGSPRSLRVIWAGVRDLPPGSLGLLQRGLVDALAEAGVRWEPSDFHPHLTLGRANRREPAARSEAMHRALKGRATASSALAALQPFRCESIDLIRSDLRREGPSYTCIHRSQLGARSQLGTQDEPAS